MSIKLQAKLLRFLEDGIIRPLGGHDEKRVKVEVISATNKNLKLEVQNGRFRNDLYQRLNAFCIYLPPLRETGLKTLVYYFIDLFSKEYEKVF